jgi:hypothetical protein
MVQIGNSSNSMDISNLLWCVKYTATKSLNVQEYKQGTDVSYISIPIESEGIILFGTSKLSQIID